MECYLDNSATTRVLEPVAELVLETMTCNYGNPSSLHRKGLEAARILRKAREQIAATLKADEKEIFFTSGGTESNNWAILEGAYANRRRGNHIITSAVEHSAVRMPMQRLREEGFRITVLPVDARGKIRPEDLREALTDDTILVSVMMVNNEIGTREPIEEIGKEIRKKSPDILFHVDAIQAYGKERIFPAKWGIDLLSVSGHKFHAPKGTGFLYIRDKAKIRPMILGGGQQRGMRSGTDNVPGAAGLGLAAEIAYQKLQENTGHMRLLQRELIEGLEKLPDVTVISDRDGSGAPHIVTAAFAGVRSEVLLHALEEKEIYVSSGSACTSNKKTPVSGVIREIRLSKELQDSVLRFSLCGLTSEEEIRFCLDSLRECLPRLRRYTQR